MGTPLFERLPRGPRLTATGELLIRHVRETLKEHARMLAQMAALKGLTRGDVTIVTMTSLASSDAGAITQTASLAQRARAPL